VGLQNEKTNIKLSYQMVCILIYLLILGEVLESICPAYSKIYVSFLVEIIMGICFDSHDFITTDFIY
jgi:hypothetical protein